ncbi:type VI secretion system baseplate subunit TssF, partial [Pseudomonadota bacterium]
QSLSKSVLRLVLRCQNESMTFEDMAPEKIRFYLKGESTHVNQLYAMLFNQLAAVSLANSADDSDAKALGKRNVLEVGYSADEGMLPYSSRSFMGYRLLTEYFVFPQKFLFFEFGNLPAGVFEKRGQTIELFFYFNSESTELERGVSADTFALGCTPVVNLFKQRAEPVRMTQYSEEYHISADTSRPLSKEIYGIDSVVATSNTEEALEFKPFYSFDHTDNGHKSMYWHATRQAPEQNGDDRLDAGTEMFMSLVDLSFKTIKKDGWTLSCETTCLNRDLPERLPYGGGEPSLSLVTSQVPINSITCLTAPTRTRRLYADDELRWRLISHLNLNYSSMLGGSDSAMVLKEMLKLYNFDDSPSSNSLIESVLDIKSCQVMSRVSSEGSVGGMCRGLEITVFVDEGRFESSGLYLFGSVLERFFALFAPINSFTRLVLTSPNREVPIRKWPPRAGEKQLA